MVAAGAAAAEEDDAGAEERERERADGERLTRQLKERIAYYEARIAARERGEDPDAKPS